MMNILLNFQILAKQILDFINFLLQNTSIYKYS